MIIPLLLTTSSFTSPLCVSISLLFKYFPLSHPAQRFALLLHLFEKTLLVLPNLYKKPASQSLISHLLTSLCLWSHLPTFSTFAPVTESPFLLESVSPLELWTSFVH